MTVPLMDPHSQYAAVRAQITRAIGEVIDSGRFILGPRVAEVERVFAEQVGTAFGIGVANGTDALLIALRALGVQPGDEVICPSFTFYATAESIAAVGAVPVFADIEDETYCLDPAAVEAAITPRTRAVMPVHLFGHPAAMGLLRAICAKHDLALLEDAAQAYGASLDGVRCGALGDAATFSFFPTKNLPCFGDGGLITTPSAEVDHACRVLRFHGSEDKQTFTEVGYNSRLDELQAAILLELRPYVDSWNDGRIAVAARYEELGLGEHVVLPAVAPGGAARLPPLHGPQPGARRPRFGPERGGHWNRGVLLDAAAPATRVRTPRLRRGVAAGDRALRARMPRAAHVAHAGRGGSARGRADGRVPLSGQNVDF